MFKSLDPRSWPLTVKIAAVVTGLLIATIVIITLQAVNRETANVEEELAQQAALLLDVLVVPITDPLYFLDVDTISDILENLGEDNLVILFGQVYDRDGRIVSDAFSESITLNVGADPFGVKVVGSEGEFLERKPDMVIAARPIRIGNQTIGGMAVGLSTEPLISKIEIIRNQGFSTALAAGFLGIVISILLSRLITNPLTKLVEATEEIAQGKIWNKITVTGQDEIGVLANAMENMRKELYSIYSGLESEIMDRSLALEASELRFKEVVSAISDYIYVAEYSPETGWKWQYISQKIDKLLGYPYELIQRTDLLWSRFVYPKDLSIAQEQEENFRIGISSEAEFRFLKNNQATIWVRNSGRAVMELEGSSTIVYGVLSDITDRKGVEKEIAAARDKALEGSQIKTQFIANVSHELRTPLNAILGYSEILKVGIDGELNRQQEEKLNHIISSTNQMTNLINNLLDQAQLEIQTINLRISEFSPKDVLKQVDAVVAGFASNKGLHLSYHVDEKMPALIHGDMERLSQILINLINNAIKFTEHGEISTAVYPLNNKTWALEVRDTGVGMPKDALSAIFDPFRQLDGTKTDSRAGVGLGLSIVKQLAEAMGGEIDVTSKLGEGSIFTVVLPIHLPEVINV